LLFCLRFLDIPRARACDRSEFLAFSAPILFTSRIIFRLP
jgi:hypothetical protein